MEKEKKTIAVIIILLAASLLILTATLEESYEYTCQDCNVILISIDTLRADHLGCYGYYRNITPGIDEFSRDAVVFSQTISQAPSTTPSHASMLTSLIPSRHGTLKSRQTKIAENATTMAEILTSEGFTSVSFNDDGQLSSDYGFDRGFEIYDDSEYMANFSRTVEKTERWLKDNHGKSFFLFLHTHEVHRPYTPSLEDLMALEENYTGELPLNNISVKLIFEIDSGNVSITNEDLEHIINNYDAEIISMDRAFLKLIELLKRENLYNNTMIIFTSDHGEEFGEHGVVGRHSHTLYDELLKVPLIIKFPYSKYSGKVIDDQVRLIDILPTVLDVLGIRNEYNLQGETLLEVVGGSSYTRYAVSQQDTKTEMPSSIRTEKWKFYNMDGDFIKGRERLFHLPSDPGETVDLSSQNTDVFIELKDRLVSYLHSGDSGEPAEIKDETLRVLKSLGYMN